MLVYLLFVFVCVCVSPVKLQRACLLEPDPSVRYLCIMPGGATRDCQSIEPSGTTVWPDCQPVYYTTKPLEYMKCTDGNWNYIAKCLPDCGKSVAESQSVLAGVGGRKSVLGEIPWHTGIYSKQKKPYLQICGGSLVRADVVISAAHCFWGDLEKQQPASQFAVAVGKLYRPWDDPNDEAQKSDVKEIHFPPRYQGALSDFQDDIALVEVATAFKFNAFIRPVCISFDYGLRKNQLQTGNNGKVAGWGLTEANGKPSPILQVLDLPFVEISTCIENSSPDFREYITSDKICAGKLNASLALCKGDSGGGLAFPDIQYGSERFYLHGVVSTAANNEDACNTNTYTSFTSVTKHEEFIRDFLVEKFTDLLYEKRFTLESELKLTENSTRNETDVPASDHTPEVVAKDSRFLTLQKTPAPSEKPLETSFDDSDRRKQETMEKINLEAKKIELNEQLNHNLYRLTNAILNLTETLYLLPSIYYKESFAAADKEVNEKPIFFK